jgi:hypothetical protein
MLADVPHMKSTCQNVLFDVPPHNPTAQFKVNILHYWKTKLAYLAQVCT